MARTLRLDIGDTLIGWALAIAGPHWDLPTMEAFGALVRALRHQAESEASREQTA